MQEYVLPRLIQVSLKSIEYSSPVFAMVSPLVKESYSILKALPRLCQNIVACKFLGVQAVSSLVKCHAGVQDFIHFSS